MELLTKERGEPVPVTATWTEAVPPTGTANVAPFVDERVKVWLVAVTVRLTCAVCDVPPVPLAVPVTVMACAPEGSAILAAVVMVKVTVWELVPSSVTNAGLNVQSAPGGRFVVQLPGEELVDLVKFTVWVEPFTGEMVKVAEADCPAGMELGVRGRLVVRVKSLTVTIAGEDVEPLSAASPS